MFNNHITIRFYNNPPIPYFFLGLQDLDND